MIGLAKTSALAPAGLLTNECPNLLILKYSLSEPCCAVPTTPDWVRPPCNGNRVFSPVAAVPVGTKLAGTVGIAGGAMLAIGWLVGKEVLLPEFAQNCVPAILDSVTLITRASTNSLSCRTSPVEVLGPPAFVMNWRSWRWITLLDLILQED